MIDDALDSAMEIVEAGAEFILAIQDSGADIIWPVEVGQAYSNLFAAVKRMEERLGN